MRTERKKTVNWRRLAGLVGANRRHFLSATVFVLLAVCASYAIPFVTSFTLDYVIRGDASGLQLPAFLLQWLDGLEVGKTGHYPAGWENDPWHPNDTGYAHFYEQIPQRVWDKLECPKP